MNMHNVQIYEIDSMHKYLWQCHRYNAKWLDMMMMIIIMSYIYFPQ